MKLLVCRKSACALNEIYLAKLRQELMGQRGDGCKGVQSLDTHFTLHRSGRIRPSIAVISPGSLWIFLASVPSTEYPAISVVFVLNLHQRSNSMRLRPDWSIPGDAMKTHGPMSSKPSAAHPTATHTQSLDVSPRAALRLGVT